MKTFSIADPGTFDGTPYQVAERACAQAEALAAILLETVEAAEVQARNAQMSRNLLETPDNGRASEWDTSAQGRAFDKSKMAAEEVVARMQTLTRAAGYDPKHPPRA